MSRLPKLALTGIPIFLTTSVEEGLPFSAAPYIKLAVLSALARAYSLYSLTLCAYIMMGSHMHLLIILENPEHLRRFMERFKTELSHYINRLLGRKKHTIWCSGYDSPYQLTKEDVFNKLVYLYSNPSKDGLEDSIELYPNLSTWTEFKVASEQPDYIKTTKHHWLRRSSFKRLSKTRMNHKEAEAIAEQLIGRAKESDQQQLTINPNAWMSCFDITDPAEMCQINQSIQEAIKVNEDIYRTERRKNLRAVVGQQQLILAPIDRPYQPVRSGRKMWCHSVNIPVRKQFIRFAKSLVAQARVVVERWQKFDFSPLFPFGLYPPSPPRRGDWVGARVAFA